MMRLAVGCQYNNLPLNISKRKQLIVDYRKQRAVHASIHTEGASTSLKTYHGPHTPTQS
jgi:hypothetical protein